MCALNVKRPMEGENLERREDNIEERRKGRGMESVWELVAAWEKSQEVGPG